MRGRLVLIQKATLEDDHATVSEAEVTGSVAQAVTGSISRSSFFFRHAVEDRSTA